MPGRPDDVHLERAGAHDVPLGESLGPQALQRVQREDRRSGQLGEPARALAVVQVAVGQQDAADPGAERLDRREHGPPGGPRRPGRGRRPAAESAPGSCSTQVFVPSNVIGEGLGASTHLARGVAWPPCQSPTGVPARPLTRAPPARTPGPAARRRRRRRPPRCSGPSSSATSHGITWLTDRLQRNRVAHVRLVRDLLQRHDRRRHHGQRAVSAAVRR